MVATRDIGRVAAGALVEGPRQGREAIIELSGPRDTSFEDLAADLSKVLGKPVAPVHVPRAGVKGALLQAGLSEDRAGLYDEMTAGVDSGRVAFEGNGVRAVRGTVDPVEVLRVLAAV
jgi:uncharacterized protein YbjT (DUF2867 family)